MGTINYTIVPGHGPNIDRLADSLRYSVDSDTQVLVTFKVTRVHENSDGTKYDVTHDVTGEVYGLVAHSELDVMVKLRPFNNGQRMPSGIDVEAWYHPLERTGQLDWITRG